MKRGRQILLDDRDPHAVCVRTLIAQKLSDHADTLHGAPPRLPLSLVDWHSEQAKFDDGPYLCTVLGLDWIVIRSLDTKPISDWTDYNAINKQIIRLENRLGINLGSARGRLADLQNLQMSSFSYQESDLDAIGNAFGDVWRKPIIRLLTEFQPYADLIAQRVEDRSFSMQYQQWFQLYQASQKEGVTGGHASTEYGQFLQRAALADTNPKGEADFLKTLKAQNTGKRDRGLAFNVVFQRAMVEGFLEYSQFGEAAVSELAQEDDDNDVDFGDLAFDDDLELTDIEDDAFEFSEAAPGSNVTSVPSSGLGKIESALKAQYESRSSEYVAAMNRFVAAIPNLLEVDAEFESAEGKFGKFWLGSFLKAEGGIDFTQGASSRAKDILFAVAAMCLYDDMREPVEESDFNEFWATCQDPTAGAVCRKVGRVLKRMTNTDASLGGRILRSQGHSHDPDKAMDEMHDRLRYVWQGIGL
ncbi:hypothetical protein A5622_14275 [Mycobacterium sp. 1245801.1]|nr:hypothetical protein A5622_14275 [Mycobacterium sp. 1245801.1]